MAKIDVGHGQFALVDEEDEPLLSCFSWHVKNGYAVTVIDLDGKKIEVRMHQLVMRSKRGVPIDHKNGNRIDNRKENLRVTNNSVNKQNSHKSKNLFTGVQMDGRKYRSVIYYSGKQVHLGNFECPLLAAQAYDKAALELYGDDAMTNSKRIKKLFAKK